MKFYFFLFYGCEFIPLCAFLSPTGIIIAALIQQHHLNSFFILNSKITFLWNLRSLKSRSVTQRISRWTLIPVLCCNSWEIQISNKRLLICYSFQTESHLIVDERENHTIMNRYQWWRLMIVNLFATFHENKSSIAWQFLFAWLWDKPPMLCVISYIAMMVR